ncbi:glycosyltransferase family 10 [Stieleria sp. JC731]|uniref:glycosyltransferase family 10 domain-containing protein n=1 Tax=Pirellulaceae TaxID=2691357 RepID=UPI001E2EF9B2|nr:glycosyltransferase family 10 [Stieleria sp. JC731]MCC9601229.1 glycosyltransferase family 10 [Stieleria sp. JC731]
MNTSPAIRIDCRGIKIHQSAIDVIHNGRPYKFLIDDSVKKDVSFHAKIVFNQAIFSPDALNFPLPQRFAALIESPINPCYQSSIGLRDQFKTIFTHQVGLTESGTNCQELLFGTNWLGIDNGSAADKFSTVTKEKNKAISFIGNIQHDNRPAYAFRKNIANVCLRSPNVDCFGRGIREIRCKAGALAPYRFSIAMENAQSDLYFSEKLIDCLLCETVPIYYGCAGISNIFDPRGMLCFNTAEELRHCISLATLDKYQQMRPFLLANKSKAIEHNLHSHRGLFRRLAGLLPKSVSEAEPVTPRSFRRNRFVSTAKRWLHRYTSTTVASA